ncbi:MAG: nitroreductase family protein [Gammaproteobacteria bacterium]
MPKASLIRELVCSRRTIHDFKPEAVPEDLILQAIELARWAPNHRLSEPWRFYLLGPETAEAIARLNAARVAERRGAQAGDAKLRRWRQIPGWLVLTCLRPSDPDQEREDYAACCCAVQNFCLFLWSHGIGVKWTTGDVTREPRFFKLLNIDPSEEFLVGLFWYGYPAVVPQIKRRPVSEITCWRP